LKVFKIQGTVKALENSLNLGIGMYLTNCLLLLLLLLLSLA